MRNISQSAFRLRLMVLLTLLGLIAATWTALAAEGDPQAAPANGWLLTGEMPQGLAGLGLVSVGNHLTVLGGQTGPSLPVADVRTMTLGADGGFTGGWLSSSMPGPRALHGSQVYDNVVYIIGGGSPAALDSVQAAGVDANGVPFAWHNSPSLPSPRSVAGTAIAGGYFYVAGGWGSDARAHSEVFVSAIGPDGGLTPWQSTSPLPAIRSSLTLTFAKGFLYAIGGSEGATTHSTVWRARVGEGGQLGQWEALQSLPEPRFDHATAYFKGRLLVLGGSAGGASGQMSSLYSALIQDDGSLGPWQTNEVLPALPAPLDRHAVTVADLPSCGQVLYVAGGRSNGTYMRTVYRTACDPITPTFTPTPTATVRVGPWASWRNGSLTVIRPGGQSTVVLEFGNQSPPVTLGATLLGPADFTATGGQKLETVLNVMDGSYPVAITARRNAQVGERFYLYANIGPSAAPLLTGTIGRDLFLPMTVRGAIVVTPPSITPTGSPTATSTWTPTPTRTATGSVTATWTNTASPTFTPSITPTPSISITPSVTPSRTPSFTPSRTPSKTPSITPFITPSKTPSITPSKTPSKTPSITPSPTTANNGIYGKVTYKGSAAANILIELYNDDGTNATLQAATRTASDGSYKFLNVPTLASGYSYWVRFNNEDNSNYLSAWFGSYIHSYTTGTSVLGGNFDIADIVLTSPPDMFSSKLPITFTWVRRSITSETYRWALLDQSDWGFWLYGDLGYASAFTLSSLPTGASYGTEYGWFVRVYQASDAFGDSYYYGRFTAVAPAQQDEGPAPSAGLMTGPNQPWPTKRFSTFGENGSFGSRHSRESLWSTTHDAKPGRPDAR